MEAFFPRPVHLTLRDGHACRTLHFKRGVNDVPNALVDHWWLRVNNVTVIQQKLVAVRTPRPVARFKYLDSLADEIAKLGIEIEAEAQQIIQKDIAGVRVQKAMVFEQLRWALIGATRYRFWGLSWR